MKETKHRLRRGVILFLLLCIGAGIVFSVLTAVNPAADIYLQLCSLCALPAMLFAGYYMLMGYGKNAAKYFKIFAALAVFAQAAVLLAAMPGGNSAQIVIASLSLLLQLLLLLGKNLGKTVSLTVCSAVIVLAVLALLFGIDTTEPLLRIGRGVAVILLACLLWVITYAKYLDKTARGTK